MVARFKAMATATKAMGCILCLRVLPSLLPSGELRVALISMPTVNEINIRFNMLGVNISIMCDKSY